MSDAATTTVVLSGVRSTTHLLYAASWVRDLVGRSDGEIHVHVLGSGAFLGGDRVPPGAAESLLTVDPRVRVQGATLLARTTGRLVYLAVGAPGIKPYLRLRAAHRGTAIEVVVVDEGLGSYGDRSTRRAALGRQGVPEPWRSVRAAAVVGAAHVLTDRRWALYREVAGRWRVQDAVAQEFRRRLPPPVVADRAVLLSQPWVEMGVLAAEQYTAAVHDVVDALARAGLDCAVRPHPAERPERYRGMSLLDASVPAELDPTVVGSSLVLGADSTALLNLAAVYGRPALRVSLPGLEHLSAALGLRQRSLLDAFLPAPVSAEELRRPPPAGPDGRRITER